MIRLLVLCAIIGAALFYLREQPARTMRFAVDTPLEATVAAPVVAPTPVTPTPTVEPQVEIAMKSAEPPVEPTPASRPAPRANKTLAKHAAPIPTTPAPTAIAILESPSAGLPTRNAAAPRLPVTEILPDGTSRAAGGPTVPALPIAKQLSRHPVTEPVSDAAPPKKSPESVPSAAVTVVTPASPRPNQSDTFFKNAARILAETEIPK